MIQSNISRKMSSKMSFGKGFNDTYVFITRIAMDNTMIRRHLFQLIRFSEKSWKNINFLICVNIFFLHMYFVVSLKLITQEFYWRSSENYFVDRWQTNDDRLSESNVMSRMYTDSLATSNATLIKRNQVKYWKKCSLRTHLIDVYRTCRMTAKEVE